MIQRMEARQLSSSKEWSLISNSLLPAVKTLSVSVSNPISDTPANFVRSTGTCTAARPFHQSPAQRANLLQDRTLGPCGKKNV